MMHDVNILDIDGSDATFHKTLCAPGRFAAEGGLTRTPGSLSFDDLKVGTSFRITGLSSWRP